MVDWGRFDFMRHMLGKHNFGLIVPKIKKEGVGGFVTDAICGHKTYDAFDSNSLFPLYLYPEEGILDQSIQVNFSAKPYAQILKVAGLTGAPATTDGTDAFRKASGEARPDEVKVFDYIYGILHSPAYRATYAEFLKIDFPRIPFPANRDSFRAISEQGEALRRLHLMEDTAIGATPYPFHGEGDSVVEKPHHKDGQVWINSTQYFDDVPAIAWDFHIGGYQPAQKWLKDRSR
tara:strand:- start:2561 stop:3259 length:699 start_codon:yes stop_codon:yes gene_type:complete